MAVLDGLGLVFFTGINRAACYHFASSGLLLVARALSVAGCFWLSAPVGLW